MKKYLFTILAIVLIFVALTSCVQLPKIPENIEKHVEDIIKKWNALFGNTLEIVSWSYEGVIEDAVERADVLDLLTDPDSVRLVNTDDSDPTVINVLLLSSIPLNHRQEFAQSVEDLLKIGQHKVKLNWELAISGKKFTTVALVDEDNMVWDSVLGSIVIQERPVSPAGETKSDSVTIKWLWGSERGSISWSLSCDGPPLECSYDSKAKMLSGEARIETKLVKTEECCVLYYAWAYRTPTGSISIQWNSETDQFDVEVSSWGSTGSGQGVFECCP